MARLRLCLLGSFRATLDEQPLQGLRSDRTRALLAFLALEAQEAHPRERLATLLWGEYPTQSAMRSLRVSLSNLRTVLSPLLSELGDGTLLDITRRHVRLHSDHPDLWVDAGEFDGLLAASLAHSHPDLARCAACARRLESAASLYRGDLLAGLTVSRSPDFEEWRLLQQEARHRQALVALEALVQHHVGLGRHDRARHLLERQIELQPWHEGAHRDLMRLLALHEQPAAALAQYASLCRLLAEELGVEPSPDTVALAQSIRQGEPRRRERAGAPIKPAFRSHRPGPERGAPFVGRHKELAELGHSLGRALAGEGRFAFVTGDAGSGKSTLLAEFALGAEAAEPSVLAATGRCVALSNAGDPYLPFRQILRRLAGEVETGDRPAESVPVREARLQAFLPTLMSTLLEDAPDLIDLWIPASLLRDRCEELGPEGRVWQTRLEALTQRRAAALPAGAPSQAALFDQLTQLLRAVSRQRALILVLDDLQWVDGASVELLFHLGSLLEGNRILILGAFREVPVALGHNGEPHPLQALLHEFQRRFGSIILPLEPEGRGFVDAYVDTEPNHLGESFRQTLAHRTAGHPLFTVELLRSLQIGGGLVRDEDGRWVEGSVIDWDRLPARVEAVIAQQVARLPAGWQALLSAASVEGESFTAEVVADVRAIDARDTVEVLSGPLSHEYQLVQAERVSRLGSHTLSRYRFRHNLVQTYLYERLDPVERAFLHQATGEALEALVQDHMTGPVLHDVGAADLARQFEKAGLVAKAVHYLLLSARWAVLLSANREAVAHLERALGLIQGLDDSPERAEQEIAVRLALYAPLLALQGYGSLELSRSLARVQALCTRVPEAPAALNACIAVASYHALQADFDVAIREAQLARTKAVQQGMDGYAVWANQIIGYCRLYQGDLPAAHRSLEEARRLDPARPPAMLAVRGTHPQVISQTWEAWTLWLLGYPDQSRAKAEQALALAKKLEHAHTRAFALTVGGVMLHQMRGEPDRLPGWLDELSSLARRYNLAHLAADARTYESWLLASSDQGRTALDAMRDGHAAWQATSNRAMATVHLAVLADGYLKANNADAAQLALDEASATVRDTGERIVEAELWRLQGTLISRRVAASGQSVALHGQDPATAEAASCMERAVRIAHSQEARSLELRAAISLVRLRQRQGRSEEAWSLLSEVYGWFTEGFDAPDQVEAQDLLDRRLASGR